MMNEAATEKDVVLIFVGDIMLSRGIAAKMKNRNDFLFPFLKIAEDLRKADILFGNLEGPISSRGKNVGSVHSFRADPRVFEGLVFAGFDVFSLANNHIWDWGSEALADTIKFSRAYNIMPIGAGMNEEEARTPAIFEVRGTRIAFLAFTSLYPQTLVAQGDRPGVNGALLSDMEADVRTARNMADIVVASLHWGEEYKTRSNATQQKTARVLAAAGADLIMGHHPHVVQEIEKYYGSWIVYSLGNFVFDQNFSEETMEGLLLEVKVRDKRVSEVVPRSIKINSDFQPELYPK